jgi:hypothetical protein
MNKVTSSAVLITPAYAQHLLDETASANEALYPEKLNPAVIPSLVRAYARDMMRDRWLLDGKTIILDETGAVLDGQHRLLACIEADRAFETWLVKGVDRNVRHTIDSGSRTLSDVLTMKGERENTPLLASTLTWLVRHEQGVLVQPDFEISSSQMLNILKRHPGVRAHVNLVAHLPRGKGGAAIAALSYSGSLTNEKVAAKFIGAAPDHCPEAVHLDDKNEKVAGVGVPFGTTLPTPPPSDHMDSPVRPGA